MRSLIVIFMFMLISYSYSQTWPFGSSASSISSAYGARDISSTSFEYNFHEGIDIAAENGTTVLAVKSGEVVKVDMAPVLNKLVKVYNEDTEEYTLYFHVKDSNLKKGDPVTENLTIIGKVLDYTPTNSTLGDHLHLQFQEDELDRFYAYHPLYDLSYSDLVNTISITGNQIQKNENGSYIEVTIESKENDVDVNAIWIEAVGKDIYGFPFDEDFIFYEESVDFYFMVNCLDYEHTLADNKVDLDGKVLNDDQVWIFQSRPEDFYTNSDQVLKFKFFIKDDYLIGGVNQLSELKIKTIFENAKGVNVSSPFINVLSSFPYVEDKVKFDPLPNIYQDIDRISMTSQEATNDDDIYIVFNSGVGDTYAEARENTHELADDYMEDYLPGGNLKLKSSKYKYFKAAIYNTSSRELVSGITEGGYFYDEPVGVEDNIYLYIDPTITFNTNYPYLSNWYTLNFVDAYPYGDEIETWDNWKCYANNGCGEILIMDSPGIFIPTLPECYNWERDANGNVLARLEKSGTDNDGIHHTASTQIKISGVPNNFVAFGTIPVNTTWCGDLTITGDIIVPAGKELTVLPNSHINFTNNSSLIVEGVLTFIQDEVRVSVLDFQAPNSTLKNGIKIYPGGTANIENAIIKNANTGIYVNQGNANIDNCIIRNGYSGIHLYNTNSSNNDTYITSTRIYEQTVGIDFYYSTNVHLSYNEIDHNYIALSTYSSSPYLAPDDNNSESDGYNYIHTNSFGLMASYSNPWLGRISCVTFGGNNYIDGNTTKDVNLNNNCTVYAENNYWGGGPPNYYEGTGCSLDFDPFINYDPIGNQQQTITITPEEEEFNNKFTPQVTSSESSTEPTSIVSSTTTDKVGYDENWSIEWKLLYARNLMRVKKYNQAAKICESVITDFPDSARSYLALDLLWQSRKKEKNTQFSQFVKDKAKLKVKKQLYGVAELMLSANEKTKHASTLIGIENKYKDTPLVEHILFQKFMYYLYEDNNLELAKTTATELGNQFPESESYYASQRHLGNDVERPSKQQLIKNASNEETAEIPKSYELLGNYPNPFNPSTTISYALPYSSNVEITIYDITGKVVKVFNENGQTAGYQNIVWFGNNQQGSRVSSGVYFYRFKATSTSFSTSTSLDGSRKVFEKTAKLLLLK